MRIGLGGTLLRIVTCEAQPDPVTEESAQRGSCSTRGNTPPNPMSQEGNIPPLR
jgi:hypothetical protein